MCSLGVLYANGDGVAQDYAKARVLFEKAADKGDADAMRNLGLLYANGDGVAQDYVKARVLFERAALNSNDRAVANLGEHLEAAALQSEARRALFAREFTKALTAADHAHALFPENLSIETDRAHALMFLGRGEDAKALYLAHKGKPLSEQDATLWEHAIAEGFAELRKAGLTHPMMADIEKELGVLIAIGVTAAVVSLVERIPAAIRFIAPSST